MSYFWNINMSQGYSWYDQKVPGTKAKKGWEPLLHSISVQAINLFYVEN